MHRILDGYCTHHLEALSMHTELATFLCIAVRHLGMRAIADPIVIEYEPNRNVGGLSAVQFIATSSITVHTYPEYNFIYIDLFSCDDISDEAYKWVKEWFGMRPQFEFNIKNRGHSHTLVGV